MLRNLLCGAQNAVMELVRILESRGGVARRRTLLQLGFTAAELRKGVAAGIVRNPAQGVYAIPEADPQYLAAANRHGLLTCVSAASYYRLWRLHDHRELHLQLKPGVHHAGVVAHRTSRFRSAQTAPVAALADVLSDALRCLPEPEALVMVQSAVGRGEIAQEFLHRNLPGKRNAKARKVLALAYGRADSVLEVLARSHFIKAGIGFEQHVQIPGIGEVDFVLEGFLIVELDGATHFEARGVKRDRRRDNASVLRGNPVLRYFYDDVVHHPERMMSQIHGVLDRGRELGISRPRRR
ncbi:endonuclease domain-containing protein [Arthrobacter russicus]|uniref:Very-short-patch-repair endonuclease n=1 Tax=Arthrobacter russicus TaxID=172040 RepID=A0ABU1JEG0_9MICC|nr:DUF559 domain-containing protein [Arthrobacter russicus]MDR6270256.1 very-short-patch-repair endonuclease [Arthrobacter russicus]